MPGPYIHMEAARIAVERLRAGPSDFPGGPDEARRLGEIGYKWRNYLAAGAIGPDLFFLLPDFKGTVGSVLLRFVDVSLTTWKDFDDAFYSRWEKWAAPAVSGLGELPDALTGGVLSELQADMNVIASALKNLVITILAKQYDWFSLLGSGVASGVSESLFFWSDIFHYRKTYEFPHTLYRLACARGDERLIAFALGWMSHCAADITGHPFVNAKCGGPYRLHWQRHHLIENHMDALVYDDQHRGAEPYGELDTAALHMRLAFRTRRDDPPYSGAEHAPAYDYFAGFPDYTGRDDAYREHLWDLDSEDLPEDLCELILEAMRTVFRDPGDAVGHAPRILTDHPEFADRESSGAPSGRPNVPTLQEMFRTQYLYLKYMTTTGYRPAPPEPPDVIRDHAPPAFPGSDGGLGEDATRGADDPESFNLVDLLLAIFGWAVWLGEVAAWLATLPEAVIADTATYPVREALYDNVAVPLWQAYLAGRKTLVMSGYLLPKHDEIERSLVELGVSPTGPNASLAAALASPDGEPPATPLLYDEPSGRATATTSRGVDPAFPRAVVRDRFDTLVTGITGAGEGPHPSEFLSPWRYPSTNNAGAINGWEPPLSHPGPYRQGQDARILLDHMPGDPGAREAFESARTPRETELACEAQLRRDRHLGDPVDYTVYLIGKLALDAAFPDFNLDADRGYAHKCWDWNRRTDDIVLPAHQKVEPPGARATDPKFSFAAPCTIPDGFFELDTPRPDLVFRPDVPMATHYVGGPAETCADAPALSRDEVAIAGIPPEGENKR